MPGAKRQTSPGKFTLANAGRLAIRTQRYTATGIPSLIARFFGYTAICARYNASNMAALRFVLYRKKGGGKGRKVTGARLDWLRNPTPGFGPGAKAASMAGGDGELVEVESHPVLDLLADPNPEDAGFAYWELHFRQAELGGNAFHNIVFPKDRDASLYNMLPQHVRIEPAADGTVAGYYYGRDSASEVFFPSEEVLHFVFEKSLSNPYWGAGPLAAVLPEHDLRASMNQYAQALFDNDATPSTVFSFNGRLTDPQIARLEAKLNQKFGGVENKGKHFVIADGSVSKLSTELKDLDFNEGRKKLETDIATAFGLSETMIRPNEGALAQAREMRTAYARNTLLPRAVKHSEWLNEFVLPLFEGTDGLFFAVENPVPEDEVFKRDTAIQGRNSGVVSWNESRRMLGLEPVEGGDDDYRFNGVPLNALSQQFPAPATTTVNQSVPPPSQPDATGKEGVAAVERLTGIDAERAAALCQAVSNGEQSPAVVREILIAMGIPEDRVDQMVAAAEAFTPTKEEPDNADGTDGQEGQSDRAEDSAGAGDGEGKAHRHDGVVSQKALWLGAKIEGSPLYPDVSDVLVAVIDGFFQYQKAAIIAAMEAKPSGYQYGKSVRKTSVAEELARVLKLWGIVDYDRWAETMMEAVRGKLDARFVAAAAQGIRYIERYAASETPPSAFEMTNDRAKAYVDKYTADLLTGLRGVQQTTAQALSDTLAEGIREGESIAKLTRRVQAAYDGESEAGVPMSVARARTIARTETARAQDGGTIAGWAASGVVEGKRWLLSPTACEFCETAAREYANKATPLGQSFYTMGDTIRGTDGGLMQLDFADVDGPPLHPNCLCAVLPVVQGVPMEAVAPLQAVPA